MPREGLLVEIKHPGAPRRKTGARKAREQPGWPRTLTHVVIVAQGMLITVKAEPVGQRNSVQHNRKLMAPHSEANHSINLRKPKGQAEEGKKGSVVRQGKPTVELAKSSPTQWRLCEGSHHNPPKTVPRWRRGAA